MWEYANLFDVQADASDEPRIWRTEPTELRVGRMGYRTKTTKAGPRLEADIYPIWGKEEQRKARAAKKNQTPEAVRKNNEERAKRYLVQLADANFGADDLHVTLTYAGTPPEYEQARRDMRNFCDRVRRLRKKRGLDPLKYIYSIEDDEDGRKHRIHVHMLTNGGISREELEALWAKGYANADRLQPNENGLEAVARYLTKQQRNRRRWVSSKNLKKPKVRISNTKTSNAKVRRIARDFESEAKEVMEKLYPGYVFVGAKVFYSDIVSGVYIRAVMREMSGGGNRNGRLGNHRPV